MTGSVSVVLPALPSLLRLGLALLVLGPLTGAILSTLGDNQDDDAVNRIAIAMLVLGCLGLMLLMDMAL